MSKSSPSQYPARVELDVDCHQLVFVSAESNMRGDPLYVAELDGERRPIRVLRKVTRVSEVPSNDLTWPPELTEGDTARIDALFRCLALGARPRRLRTGVRFRAHDKGGHLRQHSSYLVSIRLGEGGVIQIEEDIHYQDESYY